MRTFLSKLSGVSQKTSLNYEGSVIQMNCWNLTVDNFTELGTVKSERFYKEK